MSGSQIWKGFKFIQWASLKGNIIDEDIKIHILNNSPKDDVTTDELKNCLILSGDGALIIEAIREKLNHGYEKFSLGSLQQTI